jgi:hypothetical protein
MIKKPRLLVVQLQQAVRMLPEGECTGQTDKVDNQLEKKVTAMNNGDAASRYQLESNDNKPYPPPLPNTCLSTINNSGRKIVSWSESDPENPYNWSTVRPPPMKHIPRPESSTG